jgi:hypothetical protein
LNKKKSNTQQEARTYELAGEIQVSCNARGAEAEKLVEETHVAEASEEKCKKTSVGGACRLHEA